MIDRDSKLAVGQIDVLHDEARSIVSDGGHDFCTNKGKVQPLGVQANGELLRGASNIPKSRATHIIYNAIRALIFLFAIASPVASYSQTCATQPSTSAPPPLYYCGGGLCVDSIPNWAYPTTQTAGQWLESSAAYYNSILAPLFGTLTYSAEVINAGGNQVVLNWQSQGNGGYSSILTLETPTQVCPLYWVSPSPPPQAETCTANCVGDPVNPGIGNVYLTESDVQFRGSGAIGFRRFYNSADATGVDGVPGWRHSYSRSIGIIYQTASSVPGTGGFVSSQYTTPGAACTSGFADVQSSVNSWTSASASYTGGVCVLSKAGVTIGTLAIQSYPIPQPPTSPVEYDVIRDDGQILRYTLQSGVINNPPGVSIRLAVTGSGFTVTDDQDTLESYNAAGVLQSITSRAGVVQTLSYTSGIWSGVSDSFGNSLSVTRNGQGSIGTLTISGGGSVHYGYDGAFRLMSVTNLDTTTRGYIYADGRFINALTSVVDENLVTLSSWVYNANEQATSTQQALGVNAQNLVYNTNGTVTITDALGAVRTFSYTRIGDVNRVVSISGSQCPTCEESAATTYDSAGYVSSRLDYNGNLACYSNDPTRGLELVRVEGFAPGTTCPSSLSTYTPAPGTVERKITTAWNSTWREPATITEAKRATGFTYDGSGNLHIKTITDTSVTPNVVRTWTYGYNSFGELTSIDGPRTDVTDSTAITYYTCTSGTQCGQIHTITNAAGQLTTFNTYNVYGQPLTITDRNGEFVTLGYDARMRLTSRQVGTETTGYSYYPTGLLETVTLPDSSTLTYNYNAAHQLTKVTDGAGNYVNYTPDAMGNVTAESSFDPSSVLSRTHSRVINALNQLYQDVGANPSVFTSYAYDGNGNPTSIAAPLSRTTGNQFDALNRVKQVTDAASGITHIGYDSDDNVVSVTDPATLVTSYTRNGFGDVSQLVSPSTGTTVNTFDSGGNLQTVTDARGAVATYGYDALNRLTSAANQVGGVFDPTIGYTYDVGTNGKGHLTGASDANHSLAWSYDALGRVTGRGQTAGGVTLGVGYAYTNNDLTTITTPSGQTLTYTYADHHVTGITVNSTTLLTSASYEPFGPVRGWTWGNATSEVHGHNTDGNPNQLTGAESISLGYDSGYRITGITNSSNSSLSWTDGYDSLDRLTSALQSGTALGWTYYPDGDRNQQTGAATPSPLWTSGASFTYNARGRMSSAAVSGATTNYIYNALGQLIEKSGSTTTLLMYDEAAHLVGEYTGSGGLIQETVWLGDTPVATLRPNGGSAISINYVHADQLNAPRAITRPSDNAILWRWDADPFGTAPANQNPQGIGTFVYNLRLPGQYYQAETGLNYNYFRDYDPSTGRYLESDPIGLRGGINTYAYANGNPITWSDRLGLKPGDKFPTVQAAAIDALDYVYQTYPNADIEYAGSVFPSDGGYIATNPNPGSQSSSSPSWPDGGGDAASAIYHTHGQCTPGKDNDNFSRPDSQGVQSDTFLSTWYQLPNYLETPGRIIKRFDPGKNLQAKGRVTTIRKGTACTCSN